MAIIISNGVSTKLTEKHGGVSREEIFQCFANRTGGILLDTRAEHRTDPVSKWFISKTDEGRVLKVVYMVDANSNVHIKTSYPPEEAALRIYQERYP